MVGGVRGEKTFFFTVNQGRYCGVLKSFFGPNKVQNNFEFCKIKPVRLRLTPGAIYGRVCLILEQEICQEKFIIHIILHIHLLQTVFMWFIISFSITTDKLAQDGVKMRRKEGVKLEF